MKFRITLTLIVTAILFSLPAIAADKSITAKDSTSVEFKNQTHCPVMGGKIDSTVFTDIQGQRVYHCCPGCQSKLVNDPDKYFKESAAQGILYENIQTTCPVSGEILEAKNIFVDFEGRRVYFCCENCIAKFEKEPQMFLKKIDSEVKAKKEAKGHEGHNH